MTHMTMLFIETLSPFGSIDESYSQFMKFTCLKTNNAHE